MAKSNVCQSCGMPLKKDPQGGGTEAGGAMSEKYCSYCYQNGAFTAPNMTAVQMEAFVVAKLKEMHYPAFIAKMFARNTSKLERWLNAAAAPIASIEPVSPVAPIAPVESTNVVPPVVEPEIPAAPEVPVSTPVDTFQAVPVSSEPMPIVEEVMPVAQSTTSTLAQNPPSTASNSQI